MCNDKHVQVGVGCPGKQIAHAAVNKSPCSSTVAAVRVHNHGSSLTTRIVLEYRRQFISKNCTRTLFERHGGEAVGHLAGILFFSNVRPAQPLVLNEKKKSGWGKHGIGHKGSALTPMSRWKSVLYTGCSLVWAVTPFLLFFILISVFINSTDRPIRSGEWRNSVPVDFLASSLEEASSWGCFAELVPSEVHNVVRAGTTVLVELGKPEDGVYMAIPTEQENELAFMKLKQTVPGETYKILRGTYRSREIVIQDIPGASGPARPLLSALTSVGSQRTVLLSQLPATLQGTDILYVDVLAAKAGNERVVLVNDVTQQGVVELRLDLQKWEYSYFVELCVLNLSQHTTMCVLGLGRPREPVPPLSQRTYFVQKGKVYCTAGSELTQ